MHETVELSDVQRAVLSKMEPGAWYSAAKLKASLASLRAMERVRLVKSRERDKYWAIAQPRFYIEWAKV